LGGCLAHFTNGGNWQINEQTVSWGKFQILYELRGRECSNRQSAVLWGWGFAKCHITFIVAEKLNSQFLLLNFRYMGVGRWLAENVKIPSRHMGEGSKIAKKTS